MGGGEECARWLQSHPRTLHNTVTVVMTVATVHIGGDR